MRLLLNLTKLIQKRFDRFKLKNPYKFESARKHPFSRGRNTHISTKITNPKIFNRIFRHPHIKQLPSAKERRSAASLDSGAMRFIILEAGPVRRTNTNELRNWPLPLATTTPSSRGCFSAALRVPAAMGARIFRRYGSEMRRFAQEIGVVFSLGSL